MASTAAAILFYCVALSVVAVGSSVPAADNPPRFISMEALECSNITEHSPRKLIAGPGLCPVRFDLMYKEMGRVISSCRGRPTADRCCTAFKTFACPYWDLINDNAINGCANDMFFEMVTRGRLHPGLFSLLCKEGPNGLACPPVTNP